jgi:hypothetical protein
MEANDRDIAKCDEELESLSKKAVEIEGEAQTVFVQYNQACKLHDEVTSKKNDLKVTHTAWMKELDEISKQDTEAQEKAAELAKEAKQFSLVRT